MFIGLLGFYFFGVHYTNSVLAYIYKTLSLNNTISLSRHEQVCLIRPCFERYFSHHQDERSISQCQEKYLLKRSPIKHTCSWCDKLIVLWTLYYKLPFNQFFFLQKQSICSFVWDLYYWLQLYLLLAILLNFFLFRESLCLSLSFSDLHKCFFYFDLELGLPNWWQSLISLILTETQCLIKLILQWIPADQAFSGEA